MRERVRRALITGVNGQDGILLSNLLLAKDYDVLGIGNQEVKSPYLNPKTKFKNIDIRDTGSLVKAICDFQPHEIYNLASISSVAKSFETPELTVDRKSTRLNSSHVSESRMPSSA